MVDWCVGECVCGRGRGCGCMLCVCVRVCGLAGLSRLQSAPVVSMMSAAIGDAVEGSFASYQYEKDAAAIKGA